MLGNHYFPKGTLAYPISDPVELLRSDHGLVQLMELVDDVRYYILFVL